MLTLTLTLALALTLTLTLTPANPNPNPSPSPSPTNLRYARDASSISTLYAHWGFRAEDAECAHVFVADVISPISLTRPCDSNPSLNPN